MDFGKYIKRKREIVNQALDRCLPDENKEPKSLHQAMRYSVFAGGERFRPILAIASFEAVGGKGKAILPAPPASRCSGPIARLQNLPWSNSNITHKIWYILE